MSAPAGYVTLTCEQCGKTFHRKNELVRGQKHVFCDRQCYDQWKQKQQALADKLPEETLRAWANNVHVRDTANKAIAYIRASDKRAQGFPDSDMWGECLLAMWLAGKRFRGGDIGKLCGYLFGVFQLKLKKLVASSCIDMCSIDYEDDDKDSLLLHLPAQDDGFAGLEFRWMMEKLQKLAKEKPQWGWFLDYYFNDASLSEIADRAQKKRSTVSLAVAKCRRELEAQYFDDRTPRYRQKPQYILVREEDLVPDN